MTNGRNDETKAGAPGRPEILEAPAPDGPGKVLNIAKPPPEASRLPKHIAGGFRAVGDDLERRSREWTHMVRLLDQHRLHLESAESQRDELEERLKAILPEVEESGRALKAMMERSKSGDISGDLAAQFDRNLRALDELEKTVTALNVNFLWRRSAWEQYARSVIRAQQMREEYRQALSSGR